MKKGICFIMTVVLSAMLLTACGDNGQLGNTNNRNQSENSTVHSSEPETGNQEETTGAGAQPESTDATGNGQEAENNSSGQAAENTESGQPEASDNADGQQETSNDAEEQAGKVLVVYYSASGNTQRVAETIASYTNGDTFELIPVEEYTSADLNWSQKGSRVNLEHDDESLQDIELVSTTVENFDSYDIIFMGYPIWWHEAAWVVNNFVKDNDFTGKTVIPFCTSSSSGLGESGVHLAEMAGTGDWQEGIRFSGSVSDGEVTGWLDGLDL